MLITLDAKTTLNLFANYMYLVVGSQHINFDYNPNYVISIKHVSKKIFCVGN